MRYVTSTSQLYFDLNPFTRPIADQRSKLLCDKKGNKKYHTYVREHTPNKKKMLIREVNEIQLPGISIYSLLLL